MSSPHIGLGIDAPLLVIDIGTSSIRVATSGPDGGLDHEQRQAFLPDTPAEGLVEFDANRMAEIVLDLARRTIEEVGPVSGVAIANQRCSTVLWDRRTSQAVTSGLGWQDLRTIGMCFEMAALGLRFAPNQTATKAAAMWDSVDPDRRQNLCVGTIDSWITWTLTNGATHITEPTNAAITGMLKTDCTDWDRSVLDALRIPPEAMPALGPTFGSLAEASALPGSPPILAMVGDQQASMIGQGAVAPGLAKMTFGTGGMFDICIGNAPTSFARTPNGCFPLVCWGSPTSAPVWGLEGIMLTAGTTVEWLAADLGIIDDVQSSDAIAGSVDHTDGVLFVPSLLGAGTPHWDYGARGTILGMTRGTTAAHITRAVLEGVAFAAADIVAAAEADAGYQVATLKVDGGMTRNQTFCQILATALGRPVEVSPATEATAIGAARAASVAAGWTAEIADFASAAAGALVHPATPSTNQERWADAARRSAAWYEELSAIDF